jgi:hypothetical protein
MIVMKTYHGSWIQQAVSVVGISCPDGIIPADNIVSSFGGNSSTKLGISIMLGPCKRTHPRRRSAPSPEQPQSRGHGSVPNGDDGAFAS